MEEVQALSQYPVQPRKQNLIKIIDHFVITNIFKEMIKEVFKKLITDYKLRPKTASNEDFRIRGKGF